MTRSKPDNPKHNSSKPNSSRLDTWQTADVCLDVVLPAAATPAVAPDAVTPDVGQALTRAGAEKQTDRPDSARQPTPLYVVAQDTDIATLEGLSAGCVASARINGFKGQYGRVFHTGATALVGSGQGDDPFCMGAAGEKLPEGQYTVADFAGLSPKLACLAFALGAYQFTAYKKPRPPARLILPQAVEKEAVLGAARAVFLARDLINTPANDMTPATLEAVSRHLAQAFDAAMEVTTGDGLLTENFPMIHAVGRAATVPPRLIDVTWGAEDAPKITLVGKGITFDSGGLNIKPGSGMTLMKKDMGGAAHVLALGAMIMGSGLGVRLRILIPAAENAIAGNAFRPGDILASRHGMSVEISNTDAEGRLVLGDALTLASEESPEMLFSFATLTGAARVALGPDIAPLYATDKAIAEMLCAAGEELWDPIWQLPFWDGYDAWLSSPVADINHAPSGGFAGSIIAALFLRRFVGDGVPYNHFDIFAWSPKGRPGHPKGADVFGIRAVFEVLCRKYPRPT